MKNGSLEPLHAVNDLAGIPVIDAEGHYTGDVFGALAEIESGLVRYLDVALDGGNHVLVPIGHARIDRHLDKLEIQLRAATRDALGRIPPFQAETQQCVVDDDGILLSHARAFSGEKYYAHPSYDHGSLCAGPQPVLTKHPSPGQRSGLVLLSEAPELELAPEQEDVRSRRVVDREGNEVGTLTDIVVDPQSGRVPYVLLTTTAGEFRLLPVGYVDRGADGALLLRGLERDDVSALPFWEMPELTRAREEALRAAIEARLSGDRRFERADYRAAA